MIHFSLSWSSTLPAGYFVAGTIDIPGDFLKGYLLLDFAIFFVHKKIAWIVR